MAAAAEVTSALLPCSLDDVGRVEAAGFIGRSSGVGGRGGRRRSVARAHRPAHQG